MPEYVALLDADDSLHVNLFGKNLCVCVWACAVKCLLQIRNMAKLYAHLHKLIMVCVCGHVCVGMCVGACVWGHVCGLYSPQACPIRILHSQAGPEGYLTSLKSNFRYDEFLWAVSCVRSRQNQIPSVVGQHSMSLALIPLWDLCNHKNGGITTFFNPDRQSCDCYAMSDFKARDDFVIFYGSRSNSDLLLQQGFTYLENEFDSLELRLGMSIYGTPHYMTTTTLYNNTCDIHRFEFWRE